MEIEHRNGKGSLYRIKVGDKQYNENYNKIFKKEKINGPRYVKISSNR